MGIAGLARVPTARRTGTTPVVTGTVMRVGVISLTMRAEHMGAASPYIRIAVAVVCRKKEELCLTTREGKSIPLPLRLKGIQEVDALRRQVLVQQQFHAEIGCGTAAAFASSKSFSTC